MALVKSRSPVLGGPWLQGHSPVVSDSFNDGDARVNTRKLTAGRNSGAPGGAGLQDSCVQARSSGSFSSTERGEW